ncbi:hypothetical protein HF1_05230 [Mycoplasma haemofelis str. Langford 1]|uniref:Uncharacterized protein n=1 Tax=Mycoplasma haemofelis (strain Langford 1) TaxID=941640 RepID=E8ZHB0_MYCHL|nr:hypothetical protein [Mycoplasma haemofelis]CBY92531.1 hypothetical protein HF1_05230 [Mycoplasma haemofelis str. Langford 1]
MDVEAKSKCVIYKVKEPTTNNIVTEILESWVEDEFSSWSTSSSDTFKQDIRDACLGIKPSLGAGDNKKHVYFYIRSSDQAWIYSSNLQNQDWVNKQGVTMNNLKHHTT